jgi:hypothetical protein
MTVLGCLRLSRDEIQQIIADHMAARYGVDASTVKVELWPPKDNYGNCSFANVDMPGFNVVRPEA